MAELLSDEWFIHSNERLARSKRRPVEIDGAETMTVVFCIAEVPAGAPTACSFVISASGATIAPGEHAEPDLVVHIHFTDLAELVHGKLDAASALRDGRLKVNGDVHSLTALGQWMADAHRDTLRS
jgi:putative sterol carrier protein